ncbi:MAG: hypothetical protein R2873_19300 [Caldilineaceae bacterium]
MHQPRAATARTLFSLLLVLSLVLAVAGGSGNAAPASRDQTEPADTSTIYLPVIMMSRPAMLPQTRS